MISFTSGIYSSQMFTSQKENAGLKGQVEKEKTKRKRSRSRRVSVLQHEEGSRGLLPSSAHIVLCYTLKHC